MRFSQIEFVPSGYVSQAFTDLKEISDGRMDEVLKLLELYSGKTQEHR